MLLGNRWNKCYIISLDPIGLLICFLCFIPVGGSIDVSIPAACVCVLCGYVASLRVPKMSAADWSVHFE